MHESADLLMVHYNSLMKKPHTDSHDTFGITAEVISIKNQLKVKLILKLLPGSCISDWSFEPSVIARPGHPGKSTELLDIQLISLEVTGRFDQFIQLDISAWSWILSKRVFFKNSTCCSRIATRS